MCKGESILKGGAGLTQMRLFCFLPFVLEAVSQHHTLISLEQFYFLSFFCVEDQVSF